MTAAPDHVPAPSEGATDTATRDEARIGAELLGLSGENDPFVSAVRATRMPMIITNPRLPDNPIVFANDAFCLLTGYERAEILGRNCRFLQGKDTDPDAVRRVHDAVAACERIEIEVRNYRKDGGAFWNRLLVGPVRDRQGKLIYFFASQLDVTLERERLAGLESRNAALLAEAGDRVRALEASEERLRLATETGGLGIWECDLTTGTLTASPLFRASFDLPPDGVITFADVTRIVHPEDRQRTEEVFRQALETGEDYDVEHRIQRADGSTGWMHVRAHIVRAADGTPIRTIGTSIDITGRKRRETRTQAMLQLDNQFRVLEDPEALAYAAAEILGRTLDVSRAGYGTIDPVAETITIPRDWNAPGIETIAGTLHFRQYGNYIENIKRGETVVIDDVSRDPRTRSTIEALLTLNVKSFINMPVTENSGVVALLYLNHAEPRHWSPDELAFVRDVAQRTRMAVERRRAERELRALAETLEIQVSERTDALMKAEAALRQAQKMEAVGQLTGGLAHDFNNLLTGISGSLELMQARIAQGQTRDLDRFVHAAQGAARRAAALTHRLLAFSRQQTLDPKPTNVNRLVAGMEELIRRTMGPGIAVEVVAAAGLWNTLVDPGQLENALLNLCINARDAMQDGGRLVIETGNKWLDTPGARERDLPPGQYVTLCVSDNGVGMAPDVIARAFDPFFTTKPIGMGTGLGLSMIYGFTQQSGGQARIYSELGQGTMVCLYLPRHHGAAEEALPAPGAPASPRARDGETVLIVDDEPTVRMLAMEVLEDLGYTAIEAVDGYSGLRVLQSTTRVDLLITDVGLPGGMNGRQMAEAARALRPGLKVLFITGYAENAVISHGHLDAGMYVLTKPFAIDAFEGKIRELLGR